MKKSFEPNFQTPKEKFCKEEQNKLSSNGLRDHLAEEFRNFEKTDLIWEAEQLAKSYGIYLEFDRAKTGEEKDWMYMIRISNPGGGPISREQWLAMDELSEKYTKDSDGQPSIRLTNRQNIQFHWVDKRGVLDIVKTLAQLDLRSLNGCGDNTRNVMGCPLSQFSNVFNGNAWSQKAGAYFQLPVEPYIEIFAIDPKYLRKPEESFQYGPNLLNRKFKIAFASVHRDEKTGKLYPDNCVEARTNDMGVIPIIDGNKVERFQIYIGGGQGERNGKPSLAVMGQALGITNEKNLLKAMDAVLAVHQEWGDRENRFWARLKYVIKKMGVAWYRQKVEERLGFKLEDPQPDYDYGPRHLHFGWHRQPSNGLWTYGAYIENGRLIDSGPNGRLKSMVRDVMKKYPVQLMVTPNQDVLFINVPEQMKADFEADLKKYGFGQRNGKPYSELRLRSGACVGRDTCRLTYTDSEKFEPELLDQLDQMGWGRMKESIGITGCERQCFRPATKTIGLVGAGFDRYQFKLMGDEGGRHQGGPLISSSDGQIYLRSVPREEVAKVIEVLFKFYEANKQSGEDMGAFHRRIGVDAIISHLKQNSVTTALMQKPFPADYVIE